MYFYRLAGPRDVKAIAKFMGLQSVEDRQMYFGHSISSDAVVELYRKMESNLDKQVFVIVKDRDSSLIGFVHLAQTGGNKIELGIFVQPKDRKKGVGQMLMAMSLMYTYTVMNRDLTMQCVNRNFDIQKLIKEFEKRTEVYEGERISVIPYTIDNLAKAITMFGKNMWNF